MQKVQFSLRMSDEELQIFKIMATRDGKSISDFMVDLMYSGLFEDNILTKQYEEIRDMVRGVSHISNKEKQV